jgi:probable F420-dependent oxidoreductase
VTAKARRPFTFLAAFQAVLDGQALAEEARRVEAIGFTAMVVPDHLIEQLAPIPALATIAAATERLRIGAFVHNNALRHPAVLAQDLASLDVLSAGRLDVAIGAGWRKPEFDAIGLSYETAAIRQGRLEEAVAVLKGCFGDGPFSFAGEHYTINDHDGYPKPVQRPHPPLFIGGGGRRTLTLAGREADIVGLAPRVVAGQGPDPASLTFAATQEKIGFNVYPSAWPITVTDHPRAEAARLIEHLHGRTATDLTVDEVLEAPHLFIGSISGLVEKFELLRERLGISSFMVGDSHELAAVVERLAGT